MATSEAAQLIVELLYERYCEVLEITWINFAGNAGQMSLVWNHMIPELEEHLADAADDWPTNEAPDKYILDMTTAHEAAWQCFSDTIMNSYDVVLPIYELAYEIDQWF